MRWILLAVLVGCAGRPRPTYVPLDLPMPSAPPASEQLVHDQLVGAMERGRMPRFTWSADAALPARTLSPSDLKTVPAEALWLAWVCSPRRMWGSELDLVMDREGPVPLTVQVDVDGGVHLSQGRALPDPAPERADREYWMREIAYKHGLDGVVDGERDWTLAELAAVEEALGLLDPREGLLLHGLVLSRDQTSPRHPRELALYDPMRQPVVIHVYDGAFSAGAWSFVGVPSAPRPAAVMTLVHEFGHVISDAPIAAAWDRYAAARRTLRDAEQADRRQAHSAMRSSFRDLRRMGRRGPVIRDFADLRPGRMWPTAWSTDVFESFAEAFALYRTDPQALLRVAPEAHAWFSDSGHLAWRSFPG